MSAPMKTRRTKRAIRIQIGSSKPRLYLLPKERADSVVQLIREFEVDEEEPVEWQVPVRDIIKEHTEPGATLRGARIKESLSQTDIASKLGIPPSNISEMESGKRPIGKNMAKRLSKILNIDYRVFL